GDSRIRNVDAIEVTKTRAIPRNERFTESKRAPSISISAAEADTKSPSRAAEPCDQRGRIVRANIDRSGRPSPVIVVIDPAAIVERSVAPGLVFNPSPSPRINPDPMPVAVRCPTCVNLIRHPDVTIARSVTPLAVLIQVLRPDHVGRHIARRGGMIEPIVA